MGKRLLNLFGSTQIYHLLKFVSKNSVMDGIVDGKKLWQIPFIKHFTLRKLEQ